MNLGHILQHGWARPAMSVGPPVQGGLMMRLVLASLSPAPNVLQRASSGVQSQTLGTHSGRTCGCA